MKADEEKMERGPSPLSRTRLAVFVLSLGIIWYCILTSPEERQQRCDVALEAVAKQLLMQAEAHSGKFPVSLSELEGSSPEILVCPQSHDGTLQLLYACSVDRKHFAVWCPVRHDLLGGQYSINVFYGSESGISDSSVTTRQAPCEALLLKQGEFVKEHLKAKELEDLTQLPFLDEAECGKDHRLTFRENGPDFQVLCAAANLIYWGIKPLEPRYSSWNNEVKAAKFQSLEERSPTPNSRLTQPRMIIIIFASSVAAFQLIWIITGGLSLLEGKRP